MQEKTNNIYTGNKKYFLLAGIVLIAIIIGAFAWHNSKKELLTITLPAPDVKVFINNNERQIPHDGSLKASYQVSPGHYVVLITKENYWPWGGEIDIGNTPISLNPFVLPQTPPTTELSATSSEYAAAAALLNQKLLAPRQATSSDKTVAAESVGPLIGASNLTDTKNPAFCLGDVCKKNIEVFAGSSTAPVTSIDFLDGKNNVLLVAFGQQVFALEIEQIGRQNFQPIYSGTHPEFVKKDDSSIYIRDNKKIFVVSLK